MGGDTQADIETTMEVSERSPLLQHSEHPTPVSGDDISSYGARDTSPGSQASQTLKPKDQPESSGIDEEASIAAQPAKRSLSTKQILWIVAPLVLAVFISNADSTIVIATHAIIASEFKALESSGWLFTGFMLASTVTQTTFGQLSDIYGRKPVIVAAYFIFGLGCLIVGLGQSMAMVIAGRVLSGAVSAGTSVLVSLVITDILPVREVAAWRSYVSVIGMIGRCMGGPLGGWLADVVGWRLSFIGQAPLFFIALILAWLSLPSRPKRQAHEISEPKLSNCRRVDLLGSALLAVFLLLLLLPMELGGSKLSWTDPWIGVCLFGAVVALALFIAAEKFWVASPLLPLEIFQNRHTVACFAIMALQCAAQLGLMFSVPLYFQVTQNLSNTAAGTRLLPAVIGNAIGGIMAGNFIRTTGNYRWLVSLACLMSSSAYILVIWRWHGHTGWAETLYIFPGGFAAGVALSAVFIAVQAAVDKKHLAPAVSVLYLAQGFGCAVGVAATSAATQIGLRATLQTRLVNLHLDAELQKEIIEKAASSVEYIYKTRGDIADAIVASYVDGIWLSHFVSLFASVLAFGLSALLRKYKL